MVHESIFNKVKKYNSNPIIEYKKINSFINENVCYYNCGSYTILEVFNEAFTHCKSLRGVYKSLEDCIDSNISKLELYKEVYDFYQLEEELQNDILDEFLTYCEILVCMYKIGVKYIISKDMRNVQGNGYKQLLEMVSTSLKSINYKIGNDIDFDIEEVEIIKINPSAEYVANQSPDSIGKSIILYLGARDNNVDEKESRLHKLIDLLEPSLCKYKNQERISKVKQYSQLIRHPEQYKSKPEYNWFYMDKGKYLDYIFDMCIYVQQYVLSTNHINEFDELMNQ